MFIVKSENLSHVIHKIRPDLLFQKEDGDYLF